MGTSSGSLLWLILKDGLKANINIWKLIFYRNLLFADPSPPPLLIALPPCPLPLCLCPKNIINVVGLLWEKKFLSPPPRREMLMSRDQNWNQSPHPFVSQGGSPYLDSPSQTNSCQCHCRGKLHLTLYMLNVRSASRTCTRAFTITLGVLCLITEVHLEQKAELSHQWKWSFDLVLPSLSGVVQSLGSF